MLRRFIVISVLGSCLAASANAAIVTVHIFDFDFTTDPTLQQIIDPTIFVGDTIHWVLEGGMHTTTSVAGSAESWDSGMMMTPGETFDHTFSQTGTFNYFCSFHGTDLGNGTAVGMAGTITVQPVPEPASMAVVGVGALALLRRRRSRQS